MEYKVVSKGVYVLQISISVHFMIEKTCNSRAPQIPDPADLYRIKNANQRVLSKTITAKMY